MTFDSHVLTLVDVAARLVNHLTGGMSGGVPVDPPEGPARRGPSLLRSTVRDGVRRR